MTLSNKQIVILAEDHYQELELWYPLLRMKEAGANVMVAGPKANTEYNSKLGYPVKSDEAAKDIDPNSVDAIIIPGGYAPDLMRTNDAMLKLVADVFAQGKTVAAICHAAWVLISAKVISGKQATCYHTIIDDLVNAGGNYLNQSVVVDDNLITSRMPSDLPDFCEAIINSLS